MYEAYWGLQEHPFENTPDPRFFYASSQHQEACARMLYCIRERKGAALLTGAFGCGKTMVAYAIFNELNQERYRTAYLTNPRLNDLDLLRMIAHALGAPSVPATKADVLMLLEGQIRDNANEGRDTVIVVDEAHTIQDPNVFEELRLLLNWQARDRFLITLLLLGQPELAQAINQNKAFEQRIGIKSKLEPLSLADTTAYLIHRLRLAGHPDPASIFSGDAMKLIYESSGGVPRRINRLTDICLLAGFGAKRMIDAELVRDEIKGLAV